MLAPPLKPWQRLGIALFLLLLIGFVLPVVKRSALMTERMGDLDCFLRAAWAVRSGADLYAVTDTKGIHYNYPPLLAVLATPLADPPENDGSQPTIPYLPFAVSVVVAYFINLGCLAYAVHTLANVLDPAPSSRFRWWAARLWPVLACLFPIGHTLMRGQSNLLVLALFAAALSAVIKGRGFRGGMWLAFAACLKIFPAFLFLWPLWRRDGRCLAGGAAGLVVGLGLIPLAAMGPTRTVDCYARLTEVLILPGLGTGTDTSRAEELTNATATDSQSLLVALHNNLHFDRATRPDQVSAGERLTSYLLGGVLTLLTLAAAGWRNSRDPVALTLFLGLLVLDMILLCPVCHLHYFALTVPLFAALIVKRWRDRGGLALGAGLTVLFGFNAVANLLPHIPQLIVLREGGLATVVALLLWAAGFVALLRCKPTVAVLALPADVRAAA